MREGRRIIVPHRFALGAAHRKGCVAFLPSKAAQTHVFLNPGRRGFLDLAEEVPKFVRRLFRAEARHSSMCFMTVVHERGIPPGCALRAAACDKRELAPAQDFRNFRLIEQEGLVRFKRQNLNSHGSASLQGRPTYTGDIKSHIMLPLSYFHSNTPPFLAG